MSVKIGDTFRSTYADGNPLWKVVRRSGKSAVIAVSQVEMIDIGHGRMVENDYAGIEQAFTVKQVEAAKRWENTISRLGNENDEFFASLKPGQIVHYNDGFNNFVRCEVILDADDNIQLQPIALVGDWKSYDLPKRYADGSIYLGYHAMHIVEGTGAWRPSASCVFEAPGYSKKVAGGFHPAALQSIDLSVPEMTQQEKEDAAAETMRRDMIQLLTNTDDARKAIVEAVKLALAVKS